MATTDTSATEDTNVPTVVYKVSPDQLREIHTFDDALRLMEETYGADALALASDALGDGFALAKSKDQLIDVPCAFISWKFSDGDHGRFVAARVVTEDGRKLVITDGSTGIADQLASFEALKGRAGGLVARKGLRRSDYTYPETDAKTGAVIEKPSQTYYIDTSA